jgi:hypothetical protein
MGLVPKFSKAEINKAIADKVARIELAVLLRLQRIGEQFVTDARLNGTYKDRTGNLRSSIGYIVLKNGEQYSQGGFVQVKTGVQGTGTGKNILNEASLKFPKGYVLIVVAGMSYAAAVESKGRDVLTGSSQIAVSSLKKAIERINDKTGGLSLAV